MSAGNFAQSDFSGPVGRTGCGEIHEVYAGYDQDKQGDGRKDIDPYSPY